MLPSREGHLDIEHFEVVDTGGRIAETYDCVRTTVEPWLFADVFGSGDLSGWSCTLP